MRLAMACAGRRGLRVLRHVRELVPQAQLTVFSFREEPHEPPFLEDIRAEALDHGHRFVETRKVDGPRAVSIWDDPAGIDLMLVVGWRYMIRRDVYVRPRRGTFVFHDSLLPLYRGFSPTVWAIQHGESQTGATLFAIADDVDSGPIVGNHAVPILATDTIAQVASRVTEAYLELLNRHLHELFGGTATLTPQDHSKATYAPRRTRDDDRLHWTQSAQQMCNVVRAVTSPYRGAFCHWRGRPLRVWSARTHEELVSGPAGRVVRLIPGEGAVVAAGQGTLLLQHVQSADDAPRTADDLLAPGDVLQTAQTHDGVNV